jgi:hypothetical protein|tara:strand:+ start:110 stop:430 length:321 start_codon:yes stop_codon:yes gene_type:complete
MNIFEQLFDIARQRKGMANIPPKGPYGMPYEKAEQMLYATEDPSIIGARGGSVSPRYNLENYPMEARERDRDLYLEGEGFLAGQGGTRFNRSTFAERLGKAFRGEL